MVSMGQESGSGLAGSSGSESLTVSWGLARKNLLHSLPTELLAGLSSCELLDWDLKSSWAVSKRLPFVLCHVGLSTELPSTWQLALSEQASKRTGRDKEMQKRPVSRNAREGKGSRKREVRWGPKSVHVGGTSKPFLCQGGQSEVTERECMGTRVISRHSFRKSGWKERRKTWELAKP